MCIGAIGAIDTIWRFTSCNLFFAFLFRALNNPLPALSLPYNETLYPCERTPHLFFIMNFQAEESAPSSGSKPNTPAQMAEDASSSSPMSISEGPSPAMSAASLVSSDRSLGSSTMSISTGPSPSVPPTAAVVSSKSFRC